MRGLTIAAIIVLAPLAQVTVAPLFSLGGAVPEVGLVTLLLLGLFEGPGVVMGGMPVVAILQSFVSNRAAALLVIAYVPMLPFAAALEDWRVPLWEYPRAVIAILAAGAWLRTVLALAAIAQGADHAFVPLVFEVLLPGAFLDLVLLTIAYAPLRFIGWGGRRLSLQGSRY